MPFITQIKDFLLQYQLDLCAQLSAIDGVKDFHIDTWQRPSGGGGISCVLEQGAVFEKAGVNFSHIQGTQLPLSASNQRQAWQTFEVLGVSIVIHPLNPYVPTSHCNVRFFSATNASGKHHWWFGGGFDLTPFYGFVEDCVLWHQHAQAACEPLGAEAYPTFKKHCDEYFFLKHRQEARGIGGIFYDDVNQWDQHTCFSFMQRVANHFKDAYATIVERRKNVNYGPTEREFQLYRRGRYTEFNLLYDRGTLFGLESGGRTESILISLPPLASTCYDYQPLSGSAEALLYRDFLPIKDWLRHDTLKDTLL